MLSRPYTRHLLYCFTVPQNSAPIVYGLLYEGLASHTTFWLATLDSDKMFPWREAGFSWSPWYWKSRTHLVQCNRFSSVTMDKPKYWTYHTINSTWSVPSCATASAYAESKVRMVPSSPSSPVVTYTHCCWPSSLLNRRVLPASSELLTCSHKFYWMSERYTLT